MSLAAERLEFAPPPTAGMVRALLLAIVAHGFLLAILTAGVQWKREATPVTVEAELWSSVPQQAAAPAPEEAVAPALPPEPAPPPKPAPEPEPVVVPKPVPQVDPAIALAKEKQKAKLLKEKQIQQEKLAQEKLTKEQQALEKKKQDRLAQEKALKEKAQQKELLAKANSDKAAKDKAAKDKAAKQAAQEAKADEERRQQQIKRMAGLAGTGGSGDAGSAGTATQSSGLSAGYAGRVGALILRNTVFTSEQRRLSSGNPRLEIDLIASSDGTLLEPKIIKPSGSPAWDNAVLDAIKKTKTLPRDAEGNIPSRIPLTLRPD
jgi:colicin import membrane protein